MKELLPLPDCRTKNVKSVVRLGALNWRPIFCANCGADGGLVPEAPENCNFAFYLCDKCYELHGQVEGTYAEPDSIFWEKVKQAQLEKFGRELAPEEQIEALKDENHILSKLAKERK